MKLTFYPDRLPSPTRAPHYYLDNYKLFTGVNEVEDSIALHPEFDSLVASGAIIVEKPTTKKPIAKGAAEPTEEKEPEEKETKKPEKPNAKPPANN